MLTVDINIANPDPSTCPTTFTELVQELDPLITAQVTEDFIPYIIGTDTPGADQQGYAWHRLDSNGKPVGTFLFYNGAWRREYTGVPSQVCMYQGDPSLDFGPTGYGLLEGENGSAGFWDGWHLCNGEGGTQDLRDRFIVGGRRFNAGFWETDVSGTPSYSGDGVHEIQLDADNTYRKAIAEVRVGQWGADGNAPAVGGLIGLPQNDSSDLILIPADAGMTDPPAIPTLPPYYALAFVVFLGYQ